LRRRERRERVKTNKLRVYYEVVSVAGFGNLTIKITELFKFLVRGGCNELKNNKKSEMPAIATNEEKQGK